jgi:hypothetical protein
MATQKELNKRDVRDRQLQFEIANAGLLWLWHKENSE